jgi:hypothetical protein
MKVAGDRLNPADSYESEWVGWNKAKPVRKLGGDGTPAVGLVGRGTAREVNGLGLSFKDGAALPAPPGKTPVIAGGGTDPQFKDAAPAGGLLVGLEVVIGRPFNDELIRSVRPIYRVGDKESFGEQRGTVLADPVTIKAKPGYAIGAITTKTRLWCDGLSVTFMKVDGDRLDPADSYESAWYGWNGPSRAVRAGGDGTPAVGLVGRANAKEMTGIGLLFKGQEEWAPNVGKK